MTIENIKEETVLDKAIKWSDPRVTARVQNKYEQVVPPLTDAEIAKKKKEKQRRQSKGTRCSTGLLHSPLLFVSIKNTNSWL